MISIKYIMIFLCAKLISSFIRQSYKTKLLHTSHSKKKAITFSGNEFINIIDVIDVDGQIRQMKYLDTGGSLKPIVLLSGTAQTITTWSPHVRHFMKSNRLIIPELRCQGLDTSLLTEYASIEQHIIDLEILFKNLHIEQIQLSGFSFGGRIGIAFAANKPHMVSKLSVTGVPLHRRKLGVAILESWMEGLRRNNLQDCAWSFLLNGYSDDFIEKNYHRLPQFVDMICSSNSSKRLLDLMTSCHIVEDPLTSNPYDVSNCVNKLQCEVQVIASQFDRIACLASVEELHHKIPKSSMYIMNNSGHLSPFENPILWRQKILDFMSK